MNLDGNQFDAVPEGLCAITSLTELRMNQNKVVNYFTEMCSGSEAGSYLRPINFLSLNGAPHEPK